jgi:hypothetical protein
MNHDLRLKVLFFGALFVASIQAGCNQSAPEAQKSTPNPQNREQSSQWVLESYDSTKGFTFSKDGLSYLAKCDHIFWKSTGFRQDVHDQSECVKLLPYLHKPVPIDDVSAKINGTLGFTSDDEVLVFEITSAK